MAEQVRSTKWQRGSWRTVLAMGALLLVWSLMHGPAPVPAPATWHAGATLPRVPVAGNPGTHGSAASVDTGLQRVAPRSGLMDALARGDVTAAVDLYSASYDHSSAAEADAGREALLRHASRLMHSHDSAAAMTLLRAYVAVFYRDVDAHLMLAQSYRDRGELWPAILAFQAAYQHAHEPGVRRLLRGQLNWTVSLYVQRLHEQQRSAEVVALYQALTQAQPENPHYFVALAEAYLARRERAAAISALTFVADDADVGERARAMIGDLLGAADAPG